MLSARGRRADLRDAQIAAPAGEVRQNHDTKPGGTVVFGGVTRTARGFALDSTHARVSFLTRGIGKIFPVNCRWRDADSSQHVAKVDGDRTAGIVDDVGSDGGHGEAQK